MTPLPPAPRYTVFTPSGTTPRAPRKLRIAAGQVRTRGQLLSPCACHILTEPRLCSQKQLLKVHALSSKPLRCAPGGSCFPPARLPTCTAAAMAQGAVVHSMNTLLFQTPQVPRGRWVYWASCWPVGTTFAISRTFAWWVAA